MKASDRCRIGARGPEVTLLGFGGAAIGNLYRARSDDEARETLQAAWEAGVRYIDTAPLYGLTLSERRIGDFVKDKPRDSFTISTKVGRMLDPLAPGEPSPAAAYVDTPRFKPRFDYRGEAILASFEASLERLGLDHVDVLYLHDLTPINHGSQEAYQAHFRTFFDAGGHEAMIRLRAEGRVGAIGVGVGHWPAAQQLIEEGDFDACLLAGRYTLLEQEALASFLPLCERRGVGVVIGAPYNSGILATGAVEGATYNYRPAPPAILERVRRIKAVCQAHGAPLIAAALQFPLHHPAVASIVPGVGSPQEVAAAVATLETALPPALYAELKAEGLLAEAAPT